MGLNSEVSDLRREIGHAWKLPSTKDDLIYIVTEVGELADALMRLPDFPDVAPTRNHPAVTTLGDVADEAADVLIMLVSLCDSLGIDLDLAFHDKLEYLRRKYGNRSNNGDPDHNVRDDAEHAGVPL